MNATTHLKIGDINKNLICSLCKGYYIDATTIIECLHSFCRTCIVTYLKTNKTCPVCDTVVHKTRPHQNIRSDKLLQDLVYKLVPGLYKDEMKRRREFYTRHYYAAPKRPGEERGDEMCDRFIYTEEEKISLALHLCRDGAPERVDFRRVFTSREDLKARVEQRIKEAVDVRFLQCKAAVTIGHLKKFVRLKYGLPAHFQRAGIFHSCSAGIIIIFVKWFANWRCYIELGNHFNCSAHAHEVCVVDMFYNDELLRNNCTLCDVAYFFNWRRRAPMTLTFCVYDCSSDDQPGKQPSLLTNSFCSQKKSEASTVTPSTSASSLPPVGNKTNTAFLPPVHPTPNNRTLPAVSLASNGCAPVADIRSQQQAAGGACRPAERDKNLLVKSSLELPVSSQNTPGSRKRGAKTSSCLLGKRSAKNPIPIAPAPAKVPRVFPYVVNIVESPAQAVSDQTREPCQIIGLLPVSASQAGAASAPSSRALDVPASALRFSVSSILQVVTGANSMTTSSSPCNHKQTMLSVASPHPSRPAVVPSGTPSSSVLLSSAATCQAVRMKSKNVVSAKADILEKRRLAKEPHSSSSSPATSSLSLPHSTPASSTVTITQSSHNNSVGSPTPASSASPTPAAVPIQQSQTQGSDMLTTHQNRATEHSDSNTHPLPSHTQNIVAGYRTDIQRPSGFYRETIDSHTSEAGYTHKSSHGHDASRRPCSDHGSASDNIKIKSEITSSPTSHSEESTTSCHSGSSSEKNLTGNNTSLTQSPPSDGAGVSCPTRKQTKHKKIADIANTLHKRVSDAMLNSTTPESGSPSNRRSSQSSYTGGKTLNKLAATSDPSRTLSNTSSSHKAPQSGHIFIAATSARTNQNNQSDEPLNLVKRDMNTVRHVPPGMYVLETNQVVKKHMNI